MATDLQSSNFLSLGSNPHFKFIESQNKLGRKGPLEVILSKYSGH